MASAKSDVDKFRDLLEKALSARYQAGNTIRREGNALILPEMMSIDKAVETLQAFKKGEEEEIDTHHTFKCHPNDGIVAFYRAVKAKFGEIIPAATQTFFGRMPGDSLSIQISCTESITCPVGKMQIPGLPLMFYIQPQESDNVFEGSLNVMVTHPRKYEPLLDDIFKATEEELRLHSIYKGKAINSDFEFLDLANFDPESVIFSKQIMREVRGNVLFPIERTQEWVAKGRALKRGILLYGTYGTGKTLIARWLGSVCQQHGWTFLLVPPGHTIEAALQIARFYEPCVVFFEDIDAETGKTRNSQVNTILNTIDGVLSKDAKVMTVMTTNFMKKIEKGMMRPGRIDSAIELGVPDLDALERLIRYHGKGMVADDIDIEAISVAAEGYVPAFIVEGLTKAKTYADMDSHDVIQTEDLVTAFEELRKQYRAMNEEGEHKTDGLYDSFRQTVRDELAPWMLLISKRLGIDLKE